jgi:endogenous inhibitor of DNA gyrase (YacG/DUF329 family)
MSIVIKCDYCGKERVTYPSQTHEKNFCNSECYHKWRKTLVGDLGYNWKGGKITKTCVRCGKEFKVYPSGNHHTHCSLTCANRDMADAQRGIPNPSKGSKGEANGSWNGGKKTYICQWCGDEFKAYEWTTHKFCSISCARSYQFTGEGNPNWNGGVSTENEKLRGEKPTREWRKEVFKRDNFTCQECGDTRKTLNAHHIKPWALYPELRHDIDNGVTLCVDCHEKQHKDKRNGIY